MSIHISIFHIALVLQRRLLGSGSQASTSLRVHILETLYSTDKHQSRRKAFQFK